MNDIQLAILLGKYAAMLDWALAVAKANMPPETKVQHRDAFGRTMEIVEALDPIYEVLGTIEDDIKALRERE